METLHPFDAALLAADPSLATWLAEQYAIMAPPDSTTPQPDLRGLELLGLDPLPLKKWNAVERTTGRPAGKEPRDNGWRQMDYASDDLRRWCGKGSRGNAGVRFKPGEMGVDYDPRSDTMKDDPRGNSLERAVRDFGIPRTVEAITGSGGTHLYLRFPLHVKLRKELPGYPGVEIKQHGGYFVAPGSRHPDGPLYRWAPHTSAMLDFADELEGVAIPEAPAALVAALQRPKPAPKPASADDVVPVEHIAAAFASGRPATDFRAYADWLQVGMAAHAASGGDPEALAAWSAWSAGDPKYAGEAASACAAKWDTFRADGGVGAGTLFHLLEMVPPPASDPEEDFADELEEAPVATKAPPLAGTGLTDTGNAARFALEHVGAARYVEKLRTWIAWDGRRWAFDVEGLAASALAGETVRRLAERAIRLPDEDARRRAVAWAMASHAAQRRRAMLELARPALKVPARRLDADPLALNVANGILDLRTYELRPHAPEALHTKLAPTPYDPAARCPLWERYLERVLPDPEVRACLQRLLGYGLQGGQEAKCVGFLIGKPHAGKSTGVSALEDTLGHASGADDSEDDAQVTRFYVAASTVEAFGPRQGNRPELASLMGARFAIVNEVPEGAALEAGPFKSWCGGDSIKATPKYGHPLSFRPDALLLFLGNEMPELEFSDDAAWDRVVLIPFPLTIPEAERDPALRHRFDRRGILAWLVEGHRQYRERGIDPPAACRAAQAKRRAKADPLAGFWEDATEAAAGAFTSSAALFDAYGLWAIGERIPERQRLTRRAFVEAAKKGADVRGYRWAKPHSGDRGWYGVRLRTAAQGDPLFE